MFKPYHCDNCGERYYRRQKFEVWRQTAKGKYTLDTIRECLDCMSPAISRRVLRMAHVEVSASGQVRALRAVR